MGIFGGSTTKTRQDSSQVGASDYGVAVGEGATYAPIDNFPAEVADFATAALGLAGQAVAGAGSVTTQLGDIATREKTPLSEWIPIVAIGATAVVIAAWVYRG